MARHVGGRSIVQVLGGGGSGGGQGQLESDGRGRLITLRETREYSYGVRKMDDTKTRENIGFSATLKRPRGVGVEGRGSAKRITTRYGGPCMPMRV